MATHNLMLYGAELSPEAQGFFPEMQNYHTGPDKYLKLIADAKKALSVPVIASLNGYTPGGWTSIAHQLQDAGADAIELNVYFLATERRRHQHRGRAALCRSRRCRSRGR